MYSRYESKQGIRIQFSNLLASGIVHDSNQIFQISSNQGNINFYQITFFSKQVPLLHIKKTEFEKLISDIIETFWVLRTKQTY